MYIFKEAEEEIAIMSKDTEIRFIYNNSMLYFLPRPYNESSKNSQIVSYNSFRDFKKGLTLMVKYLKHVNITCLNVFGIFLVSQTGMN